MIKKLLFSLVCVLTLCITFVSTKVSADSVPTILYVDDYVEPNMILTIESGFTESREYGFPNGMIRYSDSLTGGFLYDGDPTFTQKWTFIDNGLLLQYNGTEPIQITSITGEGGYLAVYVEPEPEPTESNAIYSGIFELLANTLYGGTENLTQTQIGLIEWFSILITISCLLLPFIIVFFVIKLLFK